MRFNPLFVAPVTDGAARRDVGAATRVVGGEMSVEPWGGGAMCAYLSAFLRDCPEFTLLVIDNPQNDAIIRL